MASFQGIKHFSRRLQNLIASMQWATEPKPNMLETNVLDKNVCEDLTFAIMMKKGETSFGGWSKGEKNMDFGAF